jgi:hypothetical protein
MEVRQQARLGLRLRRSRTEHPPMPIEHDRCSKIFLLIESPRIFSVASILALAKTLARGILAECRRVKMTVGPPMLEGRHLCLEPFSEAHGRAG